MKTPPEASHIDHRATLGEGLLFKHLSGPQERRGSKTCDQSQSPQQLEHFKMEGLHTLKDLLCQGDWLTKVILKDAYFAIPIHQSQQKYLQFQEKTYHFTCLPFGLLLAPWVFMKKPAVNFEAAGCPDDHLHRRNFDNSKLQEPRPGTFSSPGIPSGMLGVHYQFRKVCTYSGSDHRVSGPHSQLH